MRLTLPGKGMMDPSRAVLVLVLFCGVPAPICRAHTDSDSEIELHLGPDQLQGRWQAALRDLDHVLRLDADGDGQLTRAEWDEGCEETVQYVRRHLRISWQGRPLPLEFGAWTLPATFQGRAVSLEFTAPLPSSSDGLELDYGAFFDGDPWHRGHVTLRRGQEPPRRQVLRPDHRRWIIEPPVSGPENGAAPPARRPWPALGAMTAAIGWMLARAMGRRTPAPIPK